MRINKANKPLDIYLCTYHFTIKIVDGFLKVKCPSALKPSSPIYPWSQLFIELNFFYKKIKIKDKNLGKHVFGKAKLSQAKLYQIRSHISNLSS